MYTDTGVYKARSVYACEWQQTAQLALLGGLCKLCQTGKLNSTLVHTLGSHCSPHALYKGCVSHLAA